MLTSSSTEATIKYFLNFVKLQSPQISPAVIMTDCDKAQMNAISAVYPDSMVLLCWWHVLRAIRMHFCTEEFPELWERV
jgi:transposase-like protein